MDGVLVAIICAFGTFAYQLYINYNTNKQNIKLEDKKLDNEKIRLEHQNLLDKQNLLSEEKISILFAWQNLNNNSIRKKNFKEKDIETNNNDRIKLFLKQRLVHSDEDKIYFMYELVELISQTLVYSFSWQVHFLIEKNMKCVYKNIDNKNKYEVDVMVYSTLIYHYLSLEWQGINESEVSPDLILNVYLKDYSFSNSDNILKIKDGINKTIKEIAEKEKNIKNKAN